MFPEGVQDSLNRLGEFGCTWTNEQISFVRQRYESLEEPFGDVRRVYSNAQRTLQKVCEFWNCKLFFRLLTSGLITLCLACTVAQPFLIIFPWIFAILFSMGGLQIVAAFLSSIWWKKVLQPKRSIKGVLLGGLYLLAVFATLYSAIAMENCILCLCFALLQVISVFWYLISCLSGGFVAVLTWFREIHGGCALFRRHLMLFYVRDESHED